MDRNQISGEIADAAIKVHSALGPGLLESAYTGCLRHELIKRGLRVTSEVPVPVVYDGIKLEAGYKLDLLVEDTVIVELKAIEALAPIPSANNFLFEARQETDWLANKFPLSLFERRNQKVCCLMVNWFSSVSSVVNLIVVN